MRAKEHQAVLTQGSKSPLGAKIVPVTSEQKGIRVCKSNIKTILKN